MQPGSSSHMPEPPIEWLQKAADQKLELTGVNIVKALRFRRHIQVLDAKNNVLDSVKRLDECKNFRVTERGQKLLEAAKQTGLPFKKSDLPKGHEMWLSTLRRCARNIPKGLKLACEDGELSVLATDLEGKVANDAVHRIASFKVPWHEK